MTRVAAFSSMGKAGGAVWPSGSAWLAAAAQRRNATASRAQRRRWLGMARSHGAWESVQLDWQCHVTQLAPLARPLPAPSHRPHMAAEAPLVLGPLGSEERKAMAAHYVAVAKQYYALARTLDPSAKVPKTPGRKRKGEEADGAAAPKKKREATAYTAFMSATLPTFRKQVRCLPPLVRTGLPSRGARCGVLPPGAAGGVRGALARRTRVEWGGHSTRESPKP